MIFGKEVSCSMEGDTAGPCLFFQQTEDDDVEQLHFVQM